MRPPYPLQQGHRPCTHSAMQKTSFAFFFPHVSSGRTETEPTGAMESKQKNACIRMDACIFHAIGYTIALLASFAYFAWRF